MSNTLHHFCLHIQNRSRLARQLSCLQMPTVTDRFLFHSNLRRNQILKLVSIYQCYVSFYWPGSFAGSKFSTKTIALGKMNWVKIERPCKRYHIWELNWWSYLIMYSFVSAQTKSSTLWTVMHHFIHIRNLFFYYVFYLLCFRSGL